MTAKLLLTTLLPLVADLSRDLPERERLRRLLAALRQLLPADAVALLRLEGDCLRPVAIDGLVPDALGRRFRLAEHPRLAQLLAAGQAMRFAQLVGGAGQIRRAVDQRAVQVEEHGIDAGMRGRSTAHARARQANR